MMMIFSLPPILMPFTSMIVSEGWNKRFAFLYGAAMRFTFSTKGCALIKRSSIFEVSPTKPKTL